MIKWLCRKLGHREYSYVQDYFTNPEFPSCDVLDRITVKHTQCRCGHHKSEEILDRSGYTNATLPRSMWNDIRKNGRTPT